MSVRIDKWLKVARMFKTRSQAAQACSSGKVLLNGTKAKARRTVKIGDRIEVEKGFSQKILLVEGVHDRPIPKREARELYQDLTPPEPAPDPFERLLRKPLLRREPGTGRPTKRERRRLREIFPEQFEESD